MVGDLSFGEQAIMMNRLSFEEQAIDQLNERLAAAQARIVELETRRSIADIYENVKAHFIENPTHGANCSTMDKYIQEIRSATGGFVSPEEYDAMTETQRRAYDSILYILRSAGSRR